MTEVSFAVLDVVAEPYAVTPVLTARIGIEADADEPVHAIALRCQVRIEPLRRGYTDDEAAGLLDLFGPRERWSTTQHNFLFLHSSAMVPGFTGVTQVDLPLECTYDFEVTASKYFHALRDGAIPLQFLFSGTIFAKGSNNFAVHQVPWDREDHYDLPVSVWRDLIAAALSQHGLGTTEPRHPRRPGRLQVGTRHARVRRRRQLAACAAQTTEDAR